MNQYIKSPNFSSRNGQQVLGCVIHITDGDTRSVISHFTNPASKVSAHYLVTRTGDIIQFVEESKVAWHAGYKVRPTAKLVLDRIELNPNSYLIGIEHECLSNQDLTEIQYVNSAKLLSEICKRWSIPLSREFILKHNEIRRDKSCPGIVSMEKLINLTFDPPQISEISELQIKISLLQKILELLKAITFYKKLGSNDDCELSQ